MPVNSRHPDYTHASPQWTRCAAAYDGTDSIKAAKEEYLPRLSKQLDSDYDAYAKRALFYGATERTVQGLVGAAISRPFQVELPAVLEYLTQTATLTGDSLEGVVKKAVRETLVSGRLGILVERSAAQEGGKPYLSTYHAAQIINWSEVGGKLLFVVLEECYYDDMADPFAHREYKRWRVLSLAEGAYTQTLYKRQRAPDGVSELEIIVAEQPITPTFRGVSLDYIPFVFINADGAGCDVSKPPILSLVDVNLSHYRNSADLEHGRHFTGLPTPYVTGYKPSDGEEFRIGSAAAWIFPAPDVTVGYLEFSGAGLGTLERALESKENMMAVLGARLLETQKRAVEAADTLRIRGAGDSYTLGSISTAVAEGLSKALTYASRWEGGEAVVMQPNKQFVDSTLSAQDLTALLAAYTANAMSLDTFLWNLQKGERLRPDGTIDDEMSRIGDAKDSSADGLPALTPAEQAAAAANLEE